MTSQIVICDSSHLLRTKLLDYLKVTKGKILFLQNSLIIPRFVGLRLIVVTFQVFFGMTPYLLKSYFVFRRLLTSEPLKHKDMAWPKQFDVCGESVLGNCGLRSKIAEKIFGHRR
jgi:hypothetical protein